MTQEAFRDRLAALRKAGRMNSDLRYENVGEREECWWCGQWDGYYLGRLGQLAWYRCARCGGDFHVEADTPERRKGLED